MDGSAELETVRIGEVRSKLENKVALGVLMSALSGFVGFVIAESTFQTVLGVLGAIVFGTVTVQSARALRRGTRPDFLVIGVDGFAYNGPLGFGFVSWSEVTKIRVFSIRGGKIILGRVTHPERLQSERTRSGRLLAALDKPWADFSISTATVAPSAADVLALMQERWRRCHGQTA